MPDEAAEKFAGTAVPTRQAIKSPYLENGAISRTARCLTAKLA